MNGLRSIHDTTAPSTSALPISYSGQEYLETLLLEDAKNWIRRDANPYLRTLTTLPNDDWILSLGVKPALIRSTSHYENVVVFDPDKKEMTYNSGEVRRRGNKYVFTNDAKHDPLMCYVLGGYKIRPTIRKEYMRLPTISEITPLTRPENPDCSVCLETLTGQRLITCPNRHQIHIACFNNYTIHNKRCPECRSGYTTEETERAKSDPTKMSMRSLYTLPNLKEREAELMFGFYVKEALNTRHTSDYDKGGHHDPFRMLLSDTIHRYVKKTHSPFFITKSGLNTYERIKDTSECWTQMLEYLKSDENLTCLLNTDWVVGNHYSEDQFLTSLVALLGNDAMLTLTNTATDQLARQRLRRQMFLYHHLNRADFSVFLEDINSFFERRIKHLNDVFVEEVEVSA